MITQLVVYWIISIKKYYNVIAKDLSKQQALDVDSKAIQQVNLRKSRLI